MEGVTMVNSTVKSKQLQMPREKDIFRVAAVLWVVAVDNNGCKPGYGVFGNGMQHDFILVLCGGSDSVFLLCAAFTVNCVSPNCW
jgi:hypothetical protein